MRRLIPKTAYFWFVSVPVRSLEPISQKFGFDRGTPIDRYYIERFLEEERESIRGRVLEIHDTAYAEHFGSEHVSQMEALDVDPNNKEADIVADLRQADGIPDETYDTLIVTHTYGVIDDYEAAIRESLRILKPGGTLLATVSAMGIAWDTEGSYWRFTPAAMRYVFEKYLEKDSSLTVRPWGNVLSGQAFWVGCAAEELSRAELDHVDEHFPITVSVKVIK